MPCEQGPGSNGLHALPAVASAGMAVTKGRQIARAKANGTPRSALRPFLMPALRLSQPARSYRPRSHNRRNGKRLSSRKLRRKESKQASN